MNFGNLTSEMKIMVSTITIQIMIIIILIPILVEKREIAREGERIIII